MSKSFPDLPPEVLRSRLVALLASRGIRLTELAERLGRASGWVSQRLSGTRAATPLSDSDLAAILGATGLRIEQLARPVLYVCDYAAMAELFVEPVLIRVVKDRYGRASVKRLLSQGCIGQHNGRYFLTADGATEMERHAAEPGIRARRAEEERRIRCFAEQHAGRIYLSRGLLWLVDGNVASQVVADTGASLAIATPGIGPLRRQVTAGVRGPIFCGREETRQTVEQIVERLYQWSGDLS